MVSEKIIYRIYGPGERTAELEKLISKPRKVLASCIYQGWLIVARYGVNDGPRSKLMQVIKDYVDRG